VQAHWEQLLSEYLQTRESYCGLVVIMDARHPLTERDQGMLGWSHPPGKPDHILLTKSDKLSQGPATTQALRDVKEFLQEHFPQCNSAAVFQSQESGTWHDAEGRNCKLVFTRKKKIQTSKPG